VHGHRRQCHFDAGEKVFGGDTISRRALAADMDFNAVLLQGRYQGDIGVAGACFSW